MFLIIRDSEPGKTVLSFDLRDVLSAISELAEHSVWTATDFEGMGGETLSQLEAVADARRTVDWSELLRLAQGVTQVVDGVFKGYRKESEQPWVIVRAVDSSSFDIETQDDEVVRRIKAAFRNVTLVE